MTRVGSEHGRAGLIDRRRLSYLGGAGLAGGLLGCSRRARPADRILVSAAPTISMASLYLAFESNYFEEAGLKVELQEIREPRVTLPMLAGGKLDVSFTALSPPVLNAIAKGGRLRIVAGREVASPQCGDFGAVYGTRRRFPKGIPDFRALKGARIAVRRTAGIGDFALEVELASVGLPASAVEMLPFTDAEAMAALLGGHVDGLVSQGQIDRGHAAAPQLVRSPGLGTILPNFQYSFVLFGERLLDSPPELGARFLAAYFRGAREFLEGRTPRFMQEFARSNGLDFERLRSACRETFLADGTIDLDSIKRLSGWAAEKGYSERALSPEEAVDSRFLDLVRQRPHARRQGAILTCT